MHRAAIATSSSGSASGPTPATSSKRVSQECSTTACAAVWETMLPVHTQRQRRRPEPHGVMSTKNVTRLFANSGLYARVFTRAAFPVLDRCNGTTIAPKLNELWQGENMDPELIERRQRNRV